MPAFFDRVKETSTSTGTGDIVFAGAVAGCRTFASVLSDNQQTYYVIEGGGGNEWECGVATYHTAANSITRTQVTANSNGTTSPLNFSAGVKGVWVDATAFALSRFAQTDTANTFTQPQTATAPVASTTPITVNAATGQTADLTQWKRANGTTKAAIDKDGGLVVYGENGYYPLTVQSVGGGVGSRFSPDGSFLCNGQIETATGIRITAWGAYVGVLGFTRFTFPADGITCHPGSASNVGLRVRGEASQTADLQQWQDSAGNTVFAISKGGLPSFPNTTTAPSNTTTPVGWVDVMVAGTKYKIPLYS